MKVYSTLLLGSLFALGWAGSANGAPTIFFGEDLDIGANRPGLGPVLDGNAVAAQGDFLSNLVDVGIEDFDGFGPDAEVVPTLSGLVGVLPSTLTFLDSANGVQAEAAFFESPSLSSSVGVRVNFGRPDTGPTSFPTLLFSNILGFRLDFSSPISAFGFYGRDLGESNGVRLRLTLTPTAGNPFELEVPHSLVNQNGVTSVQNALLFYGLIDFDQSYTSIEFTPDFGEISGFDDFIVGDPVPVDSEPISWLRPLF
ncbi:MAG: hypothetical protein AAGG02_02915 [Cyanobacteria bacterium P01_H01_bin.15]